MGISCIFFFVFSHDMFVIREQRRAGDGQQCIAPMCLPSGRGQPPNAYLCGGGPARAHGLVAALITRYIDKQSGIPLGLDELVIRAVVLPGQQQNTVEASHGCCE